jgi:hypothetical protein
MVLHGLKNLVIIGFYLYNCRTLFNYSNISIS